MRIYLLAFALLISVSACVTAQEHDAVFKLLKKEYQMNPDGSLEYTYTKELKLHTKYAFNRMYGESFVVYNPDYQKLVIEYAYTIMADGKKVEAPKNAFNEVLPHEAASYPAYNGMREMVITHTALEPGCTIFLKYKIISKPKYISALMGTETFEEEVPIEKAEMVLSVPARRGLQFELLNSKNTPTEKLGNTMRSYTWTFDNIKASTHEAYTTPYSTAPTFIFSTYADMSSALQQWVNINQIKKADMPKVASKVDEFRKSTFSGLDLIKKIQQYVVNDIDTKYVPLAWHQYISQTAKEVWHNNVGNEFEKTRLLWQAYQAAGIPAEIVAFVPQTIWDSKIGDLSALSHFGVKVSVKGKGDMVMSATHVNNKSLQWEFPTYTMVSLQTFKTVVLPQQRTKFRLVADLTLDFGQSLNGYFEWQSAGDYNRDLAWLAKPQSAIKAITPTWALDTTSKDNRFDVQVPLTRASYKANFDGKVRKEADLYFWDMPRYKHGIAAQHYLPLVSERTEKMMIPAMEEVYEYAILLPKSAEWMGKPVKIDKVTDFGEMHIHIRFEDGKVRVSKRIQIKPQKATIEKALTKGMRNETKRNPLNYRSITPEEYPVFRQMMIDWFSDKANTLVFKRP